MRSSTNVSRIGVMHLTDTLEAGGLERMAVNVANLLPRDQYLPYFCTTRRDGPLADLLAGDVVRLRLERRRRFDGRAILRLASFIQVHDIQILHAHGSALFIADLASLSPPRRAVIWHDNYGGHGVVERPELLYRLATKRVSWVIAANQELAAWSRSRLRVPSERVRYVPNFICEAKPNGRPPELPGQSGTRIACVANLRPQKDHPTLLRAMALVRQQVPTAHLLLVGAISDPAYFDFIQKEILRQNLSQHVSVLGQRQDVAAILTACDIGVLSSAGEGLPLALLEYGAAGLASIATSVGQCAEVLDGGRAGMIVPPGSPVRLAKALTFLLQSPKQRASLGEQFRRQVKEIYSSGPIVEQICRVYETVLNERKGKGNRACTLNAHN